MDDNGKKTGSWIMIAGGIVLIVVLFMCIKFVLWGLGQVIHQDVPEVPFSASVSQDVSEEPDAPSFCIHCGKALPEGFQWGQFCPWCGKQVA